MADTNSKAVNLFMVDLQIRGRVFSRAVPAVDFTLFKKLPPELRLIIWEYAAQERRVISIKHSHNRSATNIRHCIATHDAFTVPGVLQACQESRMVGLMFFSLRLGAVFHSKPIYLNYKRDILFFQDTMDLVAFYNRAQYEEHHQSRAEIREVETNLKSIIIGSHRSSLNFISNRFTARLWRLDYFYAQPPPDDGYSLQWWKTDLLRLQNRWKKKTNNGKIPVIQNLKRRALVEMVRVETDKDPRVKSKVAEAEHKKNMKELIKAFQSW
jgi:2EXR family